MSAIDWKDLERFEAEVAFNAVRQRCILQCHLPGVDPYRCPKEGMKPCPRLPARIVEREAMGG